jgi:hypothetical protein
MNGSMGALRNGLGHCVLGALLLLTACTGEPDQPGGGGQEDGGGGALEASKLVASLAGGYEVQPDGSRVPPTEDELPVPLNTVEAHWYRSAGVYVIAFGGLDLAEAGPLCPGTSAQTGAGFEHVTNSPTEEGACEGAENLAGSDAGVRTCGPLVLYITEIPEDTEGDLFASLERYEEDGTIIGVTGVVEADMSAAPEIDPAAGAYTLPPDLVPDTTEVTC